jgi:hypothetical protein
MTGRGDEQSGARAGWQAGEASRVHALETAAGREWFGQPLDPSALVVGQGGGQLDQGQRVAVSGGGDLLTDAWIQVGRDAGEQAGGGGVVQPLQLDIR